MKTKQKKAPKGGISAFIRERQATVASGIAAAVIIVIGFLLFTSANQNTPVAKQQELPGASTNSTQQKVAPPSSEKKQQATAPTAPEPAKVTYRVARGDSLASIAEKFYGDANQWTRIAAANKLTNPSKIHVGNVLVIPGTSSEQAIQPETKPTPPNNNAQTPQTQTYTVASGDTLWSIAERFYGSGFEWYRIRDANKSKIGTLPNGRPKLEKGTVLIIPLRQV